MPSVVIQSLVPGAGEGLTYRAVSTTGADDVEDSSAGDPSGTAQVLRADGRYSHGE